MVSKLRAFFVKSDLKDTILRFPLSILCAAVVTFLTLTEDSFLFDSVDNAGKIIAFCILMFFAYGAWQLLTESRKSFCAVSRLEYRLGLFVLTVFGLLVTFVMAVPAVIFIYVSAATLLFVMSAPYWHNKSYDNDAFWNFNRRVWTGFVLSIITSITLWGAVAVVIKSSEFLLGFDFGRDILGDLFVFASMFFGPVYGLSFVPKQFDLGNEDVLSYPEGKKFIVNWILAPVGAIYCLILYAYTLKAGFLMSLPEGEVVWIVSIFGIAGIITVLAGWPLRAGGRYHNQGSWFIKFACKYFFYTLIVPTILLAIAIGVRIAEYGITPSRYAVVIMVTWFVLLSLYTIIRKGRIQLRVIPISLMVLLLIGAFGGPISAVNTSFNSQLSRLQSTLQQNGLLVDGRLVKASAAQDLEINFANQKSISSMVKFFYDYKSEQRLAEAFDVNEEALPDSAAAFTGNMLGINFISKWQKADDSNQGVRLSMRNSLLDSSYSLSGFDIAYHGKYHKHDRTDSATKTILLNDQMKNFTLGYDGKAYFRVEIEGHNDPLLFDIKDVLAPDGNVLLSPPCKNQLVHSDSQTEEVHARLLLGRASGWLKEGALDLKSLEYIILFDFDAMNATSRPSMTILEDHCE